MSNALRSLLGRGRHALVWGSLAASFGLLGCLGSAQLSARVGYEEPVLYVAPAPVIYTTRVPGYVRAEPHRVRTYRRGHVDGAVASGRDPYRPRHRRYYPD
jgi:hypothetical protein